MFSVWYNLTYVDLRFILKTLKIQGTMAEITHVQEKSLNAVNYLAGG